MPLVIGNYTLQMHTHESTGSDYILQLIHCRMCIPTLAALLQFLLLVIMQEFQTNLKILCSS